MIINIKTKESRQNEIQVLSEVFLGKPNNIKIFYKVSETKETKNWMSHWLENKTVNATA